MLCYWDHIPIKPHFNFGFVWFSRIDLYFWAVYFGVCRHVMNTWISSRCINTSIWEGPTWCIDAVDYHRLCSAVKSGEKELVHWSRLPRFPSIKSSQSWYVWLSTGIHKISRPMVPFLQGTPSNDFLGWHPFHRMPGPSHKARQLAWKYGRGASCKNAIENIHGESYYPQLFFCVQCCNLPSINRRSMYIG